MCKERIANKGSEGRKENRERLRVYFEGAGGAGRVVLKGVREGEKGRHYA